MTGYLSPETMEERRKWHFKKITKRKELSTMNSISGEKNTLEMKRKLRHSQMKENERMH